MSVNKNFAQKQNDMIIISDMDNTYKKTKGFIGLIDLWNIFFTKKSYDDIPKLYKNLQAQGVKIYMLTNQTKFSRKNTLKQFKKDGFTPDTLIVRRLFEKGVKHKTKNIEYLISKNETSKYVLIGDNLGEDSEIYQSMEKKYPDRISAIFIRPLKKKKQVPQEQYKYTNSEDIRIVVYSLMYPDK